LIKVKVNFLNSVIYNYSPFWSNFTILYLHMILAGILLKNEILRY
jgi:uncharacterized membrane protein